jgi:hypothetical protein
MSNVPQTPNFKLFQPMFDRKAWHQYVNKNFSIIDAVLTTYLDVGNIVGVWENSTSYNEGDRVIDPVVGQVFEAASDHTSAASPTTFAEDRDANPTYWTSLAVTARGLGAWAPGTLYQPNDFVVDGTIYAVCIATHTSTGVFADDAAFWDYLIDISSLPTLPSTIGQALNVLRVKADESGAEWADETSIIAWLGLDSAAFLPSSTFASAAHNHAVADLSDASANGRSLISAANYAAMKVLLTCNGALANLNTVGTAQIDNDAVTYAKIQNVTDARLLGRSAGSSGDAQEITVGSGLSLSAGALTAALNLSPKFLVNKGATDQTGINSTVTVTFSTEVIDDADCFASNTFTPNVAGTYVLFFHCGWGIGAAGEDLTIRIRKNGADLAIHQAERAGPAQIGQFVMVMDVANGTTDAYTAVVTAASSDTVRGDITATFFGGFRIA